jgi:hypothetical protein
MRERLSVYSLNTETQRPQRRIKVKNRDTEITDKNSFLDSYPVPMRILVSLPVDAIARLLTRAALFLSTHLPACLRARLCFYRLRTPNSRPSRFSRYSLLVIAPTVPGGSGLIGRSRGHLTGVPTGDGGNDETDLRFFPFPDPCACPEKDGQGQGQGHGNRHEDMSQCTTGVPTGDGGNDERTVGQMTGGRFFFRR